MPPQGDQLSAMIKEFEEKFNFFPIELRTWVVIALQKAKEIGREEELTLIAKKEGWLELPTKYTDIKTEL